MSSALHNHEAAWQHVDIDPVDPYLDALYHRKQTAARSELRRLRPGRGPFGGPFENTLLLCGIGDLRGYRLEQLARFGEQLADPIHHDLLDFSGGNAQPGGMLAPSPGDQRARDVIAIAGSVLDRMRRGHAMALAVVKESGERARAAASPAGAALGRVARKLGLHVVPQCLSKLIKTVLDFLEIASILIALWNSSEN